MVSKCTREFLDVHERYGAYNYAPFPVVIENGAGSILRDVDGRRYIDFHSCYSSVGAGYENVSFLKVVARQLKKLGGAVGRGVALTDQLVMAEKEVVEFCQMERVLFMNSGGEAWDTAVKLARKWAYTIKGVSLDTAEIIVCQNNFHGRTLGATSALTEEYYRKYFGPFLPGFRYVPFGNIKTLKENITPNTAAFITEPIQGEGGIVMPPPDYLQMARQICKENMVLFVLDEIQTGLGRTGRPFAWQWFNAKPDVILIGKFLGGGIMPVSAVASSSEAMCFEPGEHGSTYGGNPIACAIARETIRQLKSMDLISRARKKGEYLLYKLRAIKSPYVKEIRGLGLFIGIELKDAAPSAHEFVRRLLGRGLICSERGQGPLKGRVIGITPALNIDYSKIDKGVSILKSVLEES